MIVWTMYKLDTGEILWGGSSPDEESATLQIQDRPDCGLLIGIHLDNDQHWIDVSGEIPNPMDRVNVVPNRTTVVADGIDVVFFDIPAGSHIQVDGHELVVVADQGFELGADVPDVYPVRVSNCWPYLDTELVITAVEPEVDENGSNEEPVSDQDQGQNGSGP